MPDLYEDDDSGNAEIAEIRNSIPFAVIGSTTLLEVNGKKVRGRLYPWGVVEVENRRHSDFLLLRDMLIKTHMQDLKEITQDVHYENFRKKKLTETGGVSPYTRSKNITPDVPDGNAENPEELKHKIKQMEEQMRMLKAALGKDDAAAV